MSDARGSRLQPPAWSHRAAFPRDPALASPPPDPAGTVGPETAATTRLGAAAGEQPPMVDGENAGLAVVTPKGFAPSPWAGWPGGWGTGWSNWSGGGITDPVLGRKVSTVFSCVELNANALGSMPVSIAERGRSIDPTEYAWTDNPDPRLYSGWDEFVVQWAASTWTRGQAFVIATGWDWETLLPSTFMVADPDRMQVQFDDDGGREYRLNGELLMPWEVLHTRFMTLAGMAEGLSPLSAAAGNLRSAAALESYGANLAEGGGIPWGVLTSEQRLSPRQAKIAREQWREQRGDLSGDPAVLGMGLSLETLNLSPKDMALLDLRVFDEQRISSVLGVPPWLVGLAQPEGMTYANAMALFGFHWRRLRPHAKRLTNGLSRWALPIGRTCSLNAGDYVQPDLPERTAAYAAMHAAGVLTTDEWRAVENLPPLTAAQLRELVARQAPAPAQGPAAAGKASDALANSTSGSAVTQ